MMSYRTKVLALVVVAVLLAAVTVLSNPSLQGRFSEVADQFTAGSGSSEVAGQISAVSHSEVIMLDETSVAVRWDADSLTLGYLIRLDNETLGKTEAGLILEPSKRFATFEGLEPSHTYTYTIFSRRGETPGDFIEWGSGAFEIGAD